MAFALIAVAIVAMLLTNGGKDPIQNTIKEIAATATGEQNTTETRTLAEGQDEDAKTALVEVKDEEKTDETERFIVHTFTLEPKTAKRITFKTAEAEVILLEGKVAVLGPGTVSVSIDNKHCMQCGPYTKLGTYHPGYGGPYYETIPSIPLKSNAEQTLVIENNADVAQNVSLDLSISYSDSPYR